MANARLALTGGTGFIGQHLLRALTRRGYQVRVLLHASDLVVYDGRGTCHRRLPTSTR